MQDDMIFNCGIENGAQRLQRLGLHGSAVLTQVRHDYADMYRLDVAHTHCGELGHDIAVEDIEQITFGSPCQNLSVVGNRAGLAGEKSSLFMEAVRMIREMRCATHGKYPQIAIWENVPGAFSSNKGEDFRVVLEELIKISEPKAPKVPPADKNGWPYADVYVGDGWSLAYRVFDAQSICNGCYHYKVCRAADNAP